MIISFNPDVFKIKDEQTLDIIVKIFDLILEDKHLIDTRSMSMLFNEESAELTGNISFRQKQKLEKYLLQKSGSITQLHKLHLNHLTIGLTNGEVNPFDAYRIIAERSKIVVENGINDGKFIKGVCEKYTSHRKRGSIYKLIKKAINNEWIESEGGGIGEIKKTVEKWINSARYKDIHQYKVMTLFDSDRLAHNDFDVKHKDLISFLKIKPKNYSIQMTDCAYESSDLILWHILHKRKLENYVPLNVLFNSIPTLTDNQKADLRTVSIQDLDFHEYDSAKIGLSSKKIKDQFPDMFLSAFSMYDMEARCEHHKILMTLSNGTVEEISEIEQILLKIAKII